MKESYIEEIAEYFIGGEYDRAVSVTLGKSECYRDKAKDDESDKFAMAAYFLKRMINETNSKSIYEDVVRRKGQAKEIEREIHSIVTRCVDYFKVLNDFFLWFGDNVSRHRFYEEYNDDSMWALMNYNDLGYFADDVKQDNNLKLICDKLSNLVSEARINDVDGAYFFADMNKQLNCLISLQRQIHKDEAEYVKCVEFDFVPSSYSMFIKKGKYLDYIERVEEIERMKGIISDLEGLMKKIKYYKKTSLRFWKWKNF